MKKTLFSIAVMLLLIKTTNAQWTQSFDNLVHYKINFNNIQDSKQSDFLSLLLINNNPDILICWITSSGEGNIYAENDINMNDIITEMQKISFVEIADFGKSKPTKENYMETYLSLYRPPVTNVSEKLPNPAPIKDAMKQSRAYNVFKTLWIEKYPKAYKSMFPEPSAQTEEEIQKIQSIKQKND